MTYFDYNATTPLAKECLEAVIVAMSEFGNPSSTHGVGQLAKQRLIRARGEVAEFLGAAPQEIIFTSGGTESNHMAILGACAALPGRKQIVTSRVEHPSTLLLLADLEKKGYRVTKLGVDSDGNLDLSDLESAVTEETALVSLMWANNETGVIFPVNSAAEIAHKSGALFHTDAVQICGKAEVNMKSTAADFLSLSGHKMHAPKGIGVLFVRKKQWLPPIFFGHQERKMRGGTENLPGIAALGVVCGILAQNSHWKEIAWLRDYLESQILQMVPFARVNGKNALRVNNTSNICFHGLPSEVIVDKLDQLGIHVSTGAACTAGGNHPSHVLLAMGLGLGAESSVRFSLGRDTSKEEVDHLLGVLPDIIDNMRGKIQ
ncbi:cysteine desulfurase family protein [Ferrovum myxofaciens]|uniref:cysteine desulfurase n=2 Tax=root TaxID=1 RepID=A0A8F3IGC2_9PROT|nr:aminotransferase class V-fold PLP-dependent enzyme [Ferrovum myxofaciens]KXW58771.1 cysteine desulfurase NifS [Ferrovum myxofaciens]MBU6995683.1 aminotransferase class V-fold PLP-dependent enzyme [Ferrovum myxofaciens]QKE39542.2 MAG: aminotransferase class V-fold PLP-dependent enzyme [Ferrovum myxofaciens]QWY74824.1 MAG: aminotransferase class V-fold PLP-dependent enzyme [Ferrovum myxofaciens]QWY77572.1 MAG: aminotransferase class V-fold PLP-dependent enzyme [Ferrovum myxofaciens]